MRTWCILSLAIVATSTLAEAKPKPGQAPAELLVSVAIGPASTLKGLGAFADSFKPGSSAQLNDQAIREGLSAAVGATSLAGLDAAAGQYLLICDAKGSTAFALVAKVSDAKALSASAGGAHVMVNAGWAAVGPKPLLEQIGPYALASIAAQPPPAAPSATVYAPNVMARYKTVIADFRKQMLAGMAMVGGSMGQMMETYVDGMLSAFGDTEKLVATLDASAALVSLDLALTPRTGSRLARFVAIQRPSDYALLGKLPPVTPTMLFAGHFETGPYHEGLIDMMSAIYGSATGSDLRTAMAAVFKAATGDVALAMTMTPGTRMAMTQLFGVTDTAAADKAIVHLLDLFKTGRTITMMNMTSTIKSNSKTTVHDGVTLRSYDTTYDMSKMPPMQRQAMDSMFPAGGISARIAAFDKVGIVTSTSDSAVDANRAIDAARGKGTRFAPSRGTADLLAASRDRKESLVIIMDIAGLMAGFTGRPAAGAEPVVASLGFADRNAHFRIALPASTMRAVGGGKP
jgi:hypothetical protein